MSLLLRDNPLIILILLTSELWLLSSVHGACPQLGCDAAGTFKEDGFRVPVNKSRIEVWRSRTLAVSGKPQNENYGCVGDDRVVACSTFSNVNKVPRLQVLDSKTGKEYDMTAYDVPENITLPTLTRSGRILVVNNSHIALTDPVANKSTTQALPTVYPYGVHSAVALLYLDFYVISGNYSQDILIYKVDDAGLKLVTKFRVPRDGYDCGWVAFTEMTASNNRLYFYATHISNTGALIALDIIRESPYFKKAWELTDEARIGSMSRRALPFLPGTDDCVMTPDNGSDGFPPVDVIEQLIVTPDGFIIMTNVIGIVTIKDNGNSATVVASSLMERHFMTLTETNEGNGTLWMSGWPIYSETRYFLLGYDYTSYSDVNKAYYAVVLPKSLGAADTNVTSRMTSFIDLTNKFKKILVFGVSLQTNNSSDLYHTEFCPRCQVGSNKALVAVRTPAQAHQPTQNAEIVWVYPLPTKLADYEVKGQIIGVANKLVFYMSNGHTGIIMAIE